MQNKVIRCPTLFHFNFAFRRQGIHLALFRKTQLLFCTNFKALISTPFRILKTLAVPGNLDPRRNVISRTYIYKFAVRKPDSESIRPDQHHSWCTKEMQWTPWRSIQKRTIFNPLPLSDLQTTTEVKYNCSNFTILFFFFTSKQFAG